MTPTRRHLPALIASLGLLLIPAAGRADSSLSVSAPGTSASLDFRIVIPPVMQVMENSHPAQLDTRADGALSAEQRLVVLSNLKRGFCVTLRLTAPGVEHWRLQTGADSGLSLTPLGDGYRACSARAGRYTLVLQHHFDISAPGQQASLSWPVQTDITAI